MSARARLVAALLAFGASTTVLLSAGGQSAGTAATQLQLADLLFAQASYRAALSLYQNAAAGDDRHLSGRARAGTVRSALRVAEFGLAGTYADALRAADPDNPDVLTLSGDALWAGGLFNQAEEAYEAALARAPRLARAHNGRARTLASRGRLLDALDEAREALAAAPNDAEIQHTVAYLYERLRRFDDASAGYARYLQLLSPAERLDKDGRMRTLIAFLRSFSGTRPFEIVSPAGVRRHTLPFRLVKEKVVVTARLNGREDVEFTLDTGAEQTVVTAPTARRLGLPIMGQTVSAGVGPTGLRGVQLSRLEMLEVGSLKILRVPCVIKDPPLRGLPMGELESFSPLALGLSVSVDYGRREVTLGEPDPSWPSAFELPLRLHRLATVQGTANGLPVSFVVDTGGQVISLDTSTARSVFRPVERRRIGLRVFGTSGLDPEAYLLPGISLAFDDLQLPAQPVVVLNLHAPSVLLGYRIGGILGHKFLSKYRLQFDLQRSVLRLGSA